MDTIKDFEDLLFLFEKYKVKYLITGGLAFIFYAKLRYTKDMDILIEPSLQNIKQTNKALMEFVSPYLVSIPIKKGEILQLGMPPNIIDILLKIAGIQFNTAWKRRVKSRYGKIKGNCIYIDSLIRAKKENKSSPSPGRCPNINTN